MIFYRVQTMRGGDSTPWTIEFFDYLGPAEKHARDNGPAYVDAIEVDGTKADHVMLLNLAHANREAVAQQFPMRLVKKYPDPGAR